MLVFAIDVHNFIDYISGGIYTTAFDYMLLLPLLNPLYIQIINFHNLFYTVLSYFASYPLQKSNKVF